MRRSPRSPASLARFISGENAHNSYPGRLEIKIKKSRGSDGRKAAEERPGRASVDPHLRRFLAQMMSRDDRFTSAIVRHVCGVRSLCKSCSSDRSAASLVSRERVEWRASGCEREGGREASPSELQMGRQVKKKKSNYENNLLLIQIIGWFKDKPIMWKEWRPKLF